VWVSPTIYNISAQGAASSPEAVTRDRSCEVCGKPMAAMRADARFCSDACRQLGHRRAFRRESARGDTDAQPTPWPPSVAADAPTPDADEREQAGEPWMTIGEGYEQRVLERRNGKVVALSMVRLPAEEHPPGGDSARGSSPGRRTVKATP
jgi:predicted nucleic acid-binding Zn ribbon protein